MFHGTQKRQRQASEPGEQLSGQKKRQQEGMCAMFHLLQRLLISDVTSSHTLLGKSMLRTKELNFPSEFKIACTTAQKKF